MRTMGQVLMLVATMVGGASSGAGAATSTPPADRPGTPPAVTTPQNPETRPMTPEDEALKRMVGQRKSTKGISLSSGPATRPHQVLGTIRIEAPAPKDGANAKAGPNLYLNELLRAKAVETYGEEKVDGIINIAYEPASKGKVRASGTVVHFEVQNTPAKK